MVAGFCLRLYTAGMGENFDMTSVYRPNTARYLIGGYGALLDVLWSGLQNYPRPWWDFLGAVARVWPPESHAFRIAVSTAISAFDVTNGVLLYAGGTGLLGAALYLLAPLTIVVAGYGAQFDGVVLAFALAGALAIQRRHLWGALLVGMSITLKPVFVFFLAWLALRELRRDWHSIVRALGLGVLGALPGILVLAVDYGRIHEIYGAVVVGSRGWWMTPLWYLLPMVVKDWVGDPYRITFAALGLGALLAPRDPVKALGWYMLLFILTIPSWHNHHLVYVVAAAAILGGWPLYAAVFLASCYELSDNNGLQRDNWRLWVAAGPCDRLEGGNCDRRWIYEAITICLATRLAMSLPRRGSRGEDDRRSSARDDDRRTGNVDKTERRHLLEPEDA